MTREERVEMYRDYLAREGYFPSIDDDGDVRFKFEGGSYCIVVDEKDEPYFHLIFPSFWKIQNEVERAQVSLAAQYATRKTKVAKVYPVRDNVWASIEMFISPPESFETVFRRSLHALRASVYNFGKKLQELKGAYPARM